MRNFLRFVSKISIRLLAWNLLLVFLPALAILSLETYEDQLLDLQERSMVQQGRVLAAALGGLGALEAEEAERILVNMQQRVDARLRVFNPGFELLADSSRLGPRLEEPELPIPPLADESEPVRDRFIYRLGSGLYRLLDRLRPPEPPGLELELDPFRRQVYRVAVQDALEGRYKARTAPSPEGRSLMMYIAIPVRSNGEVVGAVLVSRSTYQLLRTLWDLRLNTFQVVLAAGLVAVVLSLLVSTTIARPIRQLRAEAQALVDRRGRLKGRFQASKSLDEIGDLSRALAELTRQLEQHIQFIESFATDLSHELKNPLASLRNVTEILTDVDTPEDRQRFLEMAQKDIVRLEHLVNGVREISRIDTRLDGQEKSLVQLGDLLGGLVERYEMQERGRFELHRSTEPLEVLASPERLAQVFENLLDNAASFTPADATIRVDIERRKDRAAVVIEDGGPGIPEEHLEKIFHRFFSYRPDEPPRRDEHTGLGLAIVRAIVEGYGGSVGAGNGTGGGARFTVELPLHRS